MQQAVYQWIKVVKVGAHALAQASVCDIEGVPPTIGGLHAAAGAQDPVDEDEEVIRTAGGRPPSRVSLDRDFDGNRGEPLRVSVGDTFASREAALDWPTEEAGIRWLADATTYFLLCVRDDLPAPGTRFAARTAKALATDSCRFPDDGWSLDFIGRSAGPTPNLPADWLQQVRLSPPPACESECMELAEALSLRESRRCEIELQAQSRMDAVWPVQAVVGPLDCPLKPKTKRLVGLLLDNIDPPLFKFKELFNRGRPGQCCSQPLAPMFAAPDPLHPAHPAYPSGHSTQAHALAALYTDMFPWLEKDLLAAADRVARNREIAGLHYPSDSHAGRLLAVQLVKLLLADREFSSLRASALAEWTDPCGTRPADAPP